MSIGLIGTKLGMTREFMTSGQSVPVTVIKIEKGRIKKRKRLIRNKKKKKNYIKIKNLKKNNRL